MPGARPAAGARARRAARRNRDGGPAHGRVWPEPRTRYLKEVSCSTPTGPARMHPPGGDADLGAEAELAAIGELRRGVVQDDRRIDLGEEALRRRLILGDDGIGVVRAVGLDMRDRRVEPVDDAHGDDGVEIFGAPILLARRRRRADRPPAPSRRRAPRSRHRAALSTSGARCVAAQARSTSSVSAAPQTPVRRILAFSDDAPSPWRDRPRHGR